MIVDPIGCEILRHGTLENDMSRDVDMSWTIKINIWWFQLISNDINDCEITCFQKNVSELSTYLLVFVDLLASRIKERSYVFF